MSASTMPYCVGSTGGGDGTEQDSYREGNKPDASAENIFLERLYEHGAQSAHESGRESGRSGNIQGFPWIDDECDRWHGTEGHGG